MPERPQRPLLGVGLMLLMVAGFAGMDTGVRALAGVFPVVLMLWLRYAFQALVMGLWLSLSLSAGAGFRSAHPRFQLLRGSLLLLTSAMIFFGLQHLPVPELTAINMIAPLLVTLLAAWLLHEPVSPLHWALVCGGLLGALIVIRPGSGLFGWAVLFPLAGAFSTSGHLLLILALGMAPTATLMPFIYAQIPFATAINWAVFGQWPDAWAWLGMAVIMACGAASAWLNLRERPVAAATRLEAAIAD